MTVQITIIGLGQIGTSIGLALGKYTDRVTRTGYDSVMETQNKAKAKSAVDVVKFNLGSSIEGADIVLLCIPFDQVENTLELIAPDLRPDAVVMDFSPQKSASFKAFTQHIQPGRHYIGMVPSINPQYLAGMESASADLFEKATIGVCAPAGTSAEALKLAADLVELLGAQTIFLDMLEADGMEMTGHLLPQVIAAAVLNATVGQPGWQEARRFAGRPYNQSTSALGADTLEALVQALMQNPLAATNVLDNAIGALTHIRTAVVHGNEEDLHNRLALAIADRDAWLSSRINAEWEQKAKQEAPKGSDLFKRIFMGDRRKDKK